MKAADDRKRARAVCDAATPGPWVHRKEEYDNHAEMSEALSKTVSHGGHVLHYIGHQEPIFPAVTGNGPTSKSNAEFIALARTALPQALDEIERLRKALVSAAEALESAVGYVPEYFQDKWEMDDDIKAARAALGES